jgi:hypothetical protein
MHVKAECQQTEEQDGHEPMQAFGGACVVVCHGQPPNWGKNL